MKHYKLNKSHLISFGLCVCIVVLLIVYVCLNSDNNGKRLDTIKIPSISISNYRDYYKDEGTLLKENVINDRYVSLLYQKDENYVSHLIDLKTKEEITISKILKNNQYDVFLKKIKELLLLKYPEKVVEILVNEKYAYYLGEYALEIYYNNDLKDIQTDRLFSLKIDYNEIKDYLNINTKLSETHENENGFIYDPEKISICFTFDDGPSDNKTLKIIEALEDYKMSATFFMVGYKLEKNAGIVKKVNDSHSEVGYHSYAHKRFTLQSKEEIEREFKISDDTFYNITGNHLKLTRPPYGNYNSTVLSAIDNAFIRWNIDTNDWQYKDVDYIVDYVMNNIKDRSIILFHDSYDTSVEAAIKLFEKLYYKDIQVLSVSEMAKLTGTTLENHLVYFSFS